MANGEPPSSARTLVLVVDDGRAGRVLVRMLREDGYDAELAQDGAAAIGRLARAPLPDILVTDLRMPHADGEAVALFAQSRRARLPVVVVTGYPHLAEAMGTRLDPRPAVLAKPLEYAALTRELAASRENGSPRR